MKELKQEKLIIYMREQMFDINSVKRERIISRVIRKVEEIYNQ